MVPRTQGPSASGWDPLIDDHRPMEDDVPDVTMPRIGIDPDLDRNGLEILSVEECVDLLRSHEIGRVSTSLRALPVVLPVTYTVDRETILFRTSVGTKFYAATRNAVVAFEIDDFDRATRTGWSVMVVGEASEITDPDELERARQLPLEPWIGNGDLDRYIRIPIVHVSGRRIPTAA